MIIDNEQPQNQQPRRGEMIIRKQRQNSQAMTGILHLFGMRKN
ncbi:MAG: hypothetical protein JETT_1202 [Candidatus Jettenia ecosi]|uniref:Uncharacterized protein n=1 Tax=Candidatus Jettenia ecosi TaxID=2494326 RepID=A0A533QD89_9BACT|nr:MAG: hypothetical protein JETT_1202 [Candidatus Jettenia ecosi]